MNYTTKQIKNQGVKHLSNFFPKEIFGSTTKTELYHTAHRTQALKEFKYIQYNSEDRISVLAIDIDTHQDGSSWLDYNIPEPTWTIWTDRGIQFMWALKDSIPKNADQKIVKYAKDTLNKLVFALDGDINAIGLNRVFRNPINNPSRFTGNLVALKDFDLRTPTQNWWDSLKRQLAPADVDLFGNKAQAQGLATYDLSSMNVGDGRNIALFDELRHYAYAQANTGAYTEFDLCRKAEYLNSVFGTPMSFKEVNATISSIDEFIETRYKKGIYMKNTSPEKRKEIAKKNGAKSGEARTKIARTKILVALNRHITFELKITVSGIAKESGTNGRTVKKYLEEMGYKEVSRMVGWKK